MEIPVSLLGAPLGVVVGWVLATVTRHFEEVWFGAKLTIDCQHAPGNKDETADRIYIKFRVQNTTKRRVAKNCRAYLVELHRISNGRVVSENLISDTFQLPWAGHDFETRDIPAKVSQYVNLVRFSKHAPDWEFLTKPGFYASLALLPKHRGTYRFTAVVAGDGATPKTRQIHVEYTGDWKSVTPFD
jgi:hypothetical protein